jgi:hypothetical protein
MWGDYALYCFQNSVMRNFGKDKNFRFMRSGHEEEKK